MKPGSPEAWIFGAVVLVLIVVLHWLAYRVGARRQEKRRAAAREAAGRPDPGRFLESKGPLIPR